MRALAQRSASLNTAMFITKYRSRSDSTGSLGPSKSCIFIDKQYNRLDRAGSQAVHVRRLPRHSLSLRENDLHFSFFLHRREAFHRRYCELEVVSASSLQQSEFLCVEACHTPVENAIFGGRLRGNTHSGLVSRNLIVT